MPKLLPIVFLIFFLVACTSPATPTAAGVTQEDYAIYGALIQASQASILGPNVKQIVINDWTGMDVQAGDIDRLLVYVKGQIPSLDPITLQDFKSINSQTYGLELRFPLSVTYNLVNPENFRQICNSQQAFKAKFPDAQGALTLSRVGFNQSRDQALVYLSTVCYKSGAGYLILMKKTGGVWNVEKRVVVWTP